MPPRLTVKQKIDRLLEDLDSGERMEAFGHMLPVACEIYGAPLPDTEPDEDGNPPEIDDSHSAFVLGALHRMIEGGYVFLYHTDKTRQLYEKWRADIAAKSEGAPPAPGEVMDLADALRLAIDAAPVARRIVIDDDVLSDNAQSEDGDMESERA